MTHGNMALAGAMLASVSMFGCLAAAPVDWECNADDPCPSGELCVAPHDLPAGQSEDATDPACYQICSSSAHCPGGSRACLDELCVLFDDNCADKECPEGFFCNVLEYCEKLPCSGGVCAPSCSDSMLDGDESDTDCGGSCTPCADGRRCARANDCQSAVCNAALKVCAVPTCRDGVANGSETGPDCGGGCAAACEAGELCRNDSDCGSDVCNDSVCQAARCDDGKLNGGESAIDCGGPCAGCPTGYPCNEPDDCESLSCAADKCLAPTCSDGAENGDETDADCGGSCDDRCAAGLKCRVAADCDSGVCDAGACRLLLSLGSTGDDLGVSVAVDADDAILVAGYTSGTDLDLGSGVIAQGGFLAKLSSTGEHLWSRRLPTGSSDYLHIAGVACDTNGSILVAGAVSDALSTDCDDTSEDCDLYLGSFSSDGEALWEKQRDAAGPGWARNVAADSKGNAFVVGGFGGTLSLDGCPEMTSASAGAQDAFVAKLSSSGGCVWAKHFGTGLAHAMGVSAIAPTPVSPDGSVAVTGWFASSIDLGDGTIQAGSSGISAFTATLSSDAGDYIWSGGFSGSRLNFGWVVAGTSDSVVEVVESFSDQGESFIAVSKVAALDGARSWGTTCGFGGISMSGSNVGVDANDNIVLAGQFDSAISFGGPTLNNYGGGGQFSIFVAKLAPDGAHIWSHAFGTGSPGVGGAVALDSTGRSVVVGTYGGTVDFGGSTLTSAGGQDIVVFTVAP